MANIQFQNPVTPTSVLDSTVVGTDAATGVEVRQEKILEAPASLVVELLQNINRELKALRLATVGIAIAQGVRISEADYDPSTFDVTASEEVEVNS